MATGRTDSVAEYRKGRSQIPASLVRELSSEKREGIFVCYVRIYVTPRFQSGSIFQRQFRSPVVVFSGMVSLEVHCNSRSNGEVKDKEASKLSKQGIFWRPSRTNATLNVADF